MKNIAHPAAVEQPKFVSGTTGLAAAAPASAQTGQYSLSGILGLWLLATAPMGLLAWVAFPLLADRVNMHPGLLLWGLMIAGLMWQAVLSLIILYRETGTLNLDAIRHRTWRQRPRDPITGQPRARLWLWLPVFAVLVAVVEFVVSPLLGEAWTAALPFLAEPAGYSLEILLDTPAQWVGAWYLLGLWLLQFVGNYLLGEEFLFRSVLLPKMEGVFGRWDWLANAVLFGLYHLHKPWHIPSSIITGILYTYPSRRFRSAWFGVILHGVDGVFFLYMMLGLVLGLT
ncbi:MAG: CPBP family intramembrane glutamic endopeptidase [Aggregatilineales bacterium]